MVIAPVTSIQKITVSGTIFDAQTKEPLVGVNVVVEGSTVGTISDISGKYSISVPDANATIIFSFIGYVTEKVPVGGRNVIDVSLIPDVQSLDEIVVIGYWYSQEK
ncbi:MAG: hypothetical protein HC905_11005 [Bacteroidales bacterium]|nr:hypothetical protein [Bacteroidales bacterium]